MIGAITAGKIMQRGRRRLLLFACFVGMIGTGINLILNMWALIIGRIILGISCGFMTVSAPRMLEEYVPPHLYSSLAPLFVAA